MECTNKLKQLALAQHDHHDVYGYLPNSIVQRSLGFDRYLTSKLNPGDPQLNLCNGLYYGWLVPTLPFNEQQAIFSSISEMVERAKKDSTVSPWHYTNTAAGSPFLNPVAAYWCPSDPIAHRGTYSPSSYRGNVGDMSFQPGPSANPRGVFQGGQFVTVSFATILDGTSNTIMASEGILDDKAGAAVGEVKRRRKGGLTVSNPINLPLCILASVPDSDDANLIAKATNCPSPYRMPGAVYGSGFFTTYFMTELPPNTPWCAGYSEWPDDNTAMPSASSYHSGGINAAMVDGSVRFISDTIDAGNPNTSISSDGQKRIGESYWGIWGSLGSINGGESTAL